MKPTLLLLAVFSLALAACKNVSVVSNRDAQGRFQTPVCPKDGIMFTDSATVYRHNVEGKEHLGVSYWNEGSAPDAPKLTKAVFR